MTVRRIYGGSRAYICCRIRVSHYIDCCCARHEIQALFFIFQFNKSPLLNSARICQSAGFKHIDVMNHNRRNYIYESVLDDDMIIFLKKRDSRANENPFRNFIAGDRYNKIKVIHLANPSSSIAHGFVNELARKRSLISTRRS